MKRQPVSDYYVYNRDGIEKKSKAEMKNLFQGHNPNNTQHTVDSRDTVIRICDRLLAKKPFVLVIVNQNLINPTTNDL